MQPYMSYLPNQNQMYQANPYSQNIYNPYDRSSQVQQYQPITSQSQMPIDQPTSIVGRVVDSFDAITANDVPMTGEPATFIKRDGSEIQLRAWTAQGTIVTTSFKPQATLEPQTANSTSNGFDSLNDRFNEFEKAFNDRFDKLESAIAPKTTRKKVEVDE